MQQPTSQPSISRAFPLLLAALTGLTALSIDMSLPAMPQMERAFGASVAAVQLTLSLFLLGFAAGQLVCGPLSDRLGRRPVLLVGLIVFTLAGLAAAASTSLPMLVGLCFIQGMGASVGPILARAIVRDLYEGREAAAVLSQITQVMVIAPLVAPIMGGYLLVHLGWPSIFLTLAGAGTILWLVCWGLLPETVRDRAVGPTGLGQLREGFRVVLGHHESRGHILTVCFSYSGMFAYISGSPFVFIDAFHVPRESFGYLFAITAGALMAGATLNRVLLSRLSPLVLLRWGVSILATAALVLGILTWLHLGGIAGVIAPMAAYLFGLGLVQPNATAAAMAPHGRLAGVSSSVIGALQTTGGALAGYCVGAFYNHTAGSLGVMVAILGSLSFLVWRVSTGSREAVESRTPAVQG